MKQPPEKRVLLHEVYVLLYLEGYARQHTKRITGRLSIICKHIHLERILQQYRVSRYRIERVSDPITGEKYDDLTQNEIVEVKQ